MMIHALNEIVHWQRILRNILNAIVLVLSLGLIVYISYDTFMNIPFLEVKSYMQFQLIVCVAFLLDFVINLLLADDKWKYVRRNFFFLLVSIPYLNIINSFDISFSPEQLYFIRYVPLMRGAYALAVVVGYVSDNKISSLFASYLAILLSMLYFASLMFYKLEYQVNPAIHSYWSALWWACMNVTTLGAPITPVTAIGKMLCVFLGGLGMLMFPLFTVYISNLITKKNSNN